MINIIENFWLKNLSWILITAFIVILWLFLWQQFFCLINVFWNTWYSPKTITIEYTITSLWAIFAFWYWFKRYERDKELEIIDKFLNWNFTIRNISELKKYTVTLIMFKKSYIPKWLWEKIVFINNDIVYDFITKYFLITNDSDKKILNSEIKNITDIILFDNDFAKYFLNYLKSIVKDIRNNEYISSSNEEKNIAANLNALIESIEETNKQYNIKL